MTSEERNLISGLFDRLAPLAYQPRDAEAEKLINAQVSSNPASPYLLVQSALVWQQALTAAQTRIADLEKQLSEARTQQVPRSFLADVGHFLGGGTPSPAVSRPVAMPQPAQMPPPIPASSPGVGFLQTALSTAAGVAGGALLFQGIEGLLGHNAGPFSGIGGGGFGGVGAFAGQPEIVNNYFEQSPSSPETGVGSHLEEQHLADQSFDDPNSDLADLGDDGSFDSFDLGGDDSSLI